MKYSKILSLVLLIPACTNTSMKEKIGESTNPVSVTVKADTTYNEELKSDSNDTLLISELSEVFAQVVQMYPKDSGSLYRFYYKWNSTEDSAKLERQIKRLNNLTSDKSKARYRSVEKNLKPLMNQIITANNISSSQSDHFTQLYLGYDYFAGESLFSQLFKDDENYTLVWKTIELMVEGSKRDTTLISNLIELNNNISTNAELGEKMQHYKIEAIKNNPLGFLEMYGQRKGDHRIKYADNITVWGDPDKRLIQIYTKISNSSPNDNHRQFSLELLEQFQN